MKIFKKSAEVGDGVAESSSVPSSASDPAENDITNLVDWYLNPDDPSPMVDPQAAQTNSLAGPVEVPLPAPAGTGTIAYTPIPAANPSDALQPVPAAAAAGENSPIHVEQAQLSEDLKELKRTVKNSLTTRLGSLLSDSSISEEQLQEKVVEGLAGVLLTQDTSSYSEAQLDQLGDELLHDILGHGPIEPLLEDPLVTEIMVNGPNQVFVERAGKIYETNVTFESDAQVRRVIDRIVSRIGRRIDESSPMVDARLPDGSRVNAIIPPLAVDGPSITIRKFSKTALTEQDLVAYKTLTWESVGLLRAFVAGKLNMLISGGTGSGKTTLLNLCSNFIPEGERVVTIEDSVELRLNQRHVVRLESRPPNIEGRGEIAIRDLVRNSLRMRPDRIVVGECRGGEALDMLQAMNTGHDGSLTTLHANSPRDCVARLETLVLMAGMDLPIRAIREQIASAIDIIVQLSRLRDGTRRVTHITEVVGMEGETITLSDIFLLETRGIDEHGNYIAELKPTGLRPMVAERLADHGIELRSSLFGDPMATEIGLG